jgi:hypothetical protein
MKEGGVKAQREVRGPGCLIIWACNRSMAPSRETCAVEFGNLFPNTRFCARM